MTFSIRLAGYALVFSILAPAQAGSPLVNDRGSCSGVVLPPHPADLRSKSTNASLPKTSPSSISPTTTANRIATTDGRLIFLQLAPTDLLPSHLMDLQGKTIRFTPAPGGYHVQALPLTWDPSFGNEIAGVSPQNWVLTHFQFPFSGQAWSQVSLNLYGNITFGADESAFYSATANRYLLFRTFAGSMTGAVPIISPLFHKLGIYDPDQTGHRFVKELNDRLVVTWLMSEPYRDTFSFTSNALPNQFQAILYSNGNIEFSYLQLSLQEGIVGVFPLDHASAAWSEPEPSEPALADYLDLTNVYLSLFDADTLRATFEVRGQPLSPGDPRLNSLFYRVFFDTDSPFTTTVNYPEAEVESGAGGGADLNYHTDGAGVDLSSLSIDGHTLSFNISRSILNGANQFSYFADSPDFDAPPGSFDQDAGTVVSLPTVIGAIHDQEDANLAGHLDVQSVVATLEGSHSIRFTFNLRGNALQPGDPLLNHAIYYRIFVDTDQPFVSGIDYGDVDIEWDVSGGPDLQYHTAGPGVSPQVEVQGPTLSFVVSIDQLGGATQFAFFCDAVDFTLASNNFDQVDASVATVPAGPSSSVDLSAMTGSEPVRSVVYEAFYYNDIPAERQLSPTVISALGDKFDFLAFYTDFRIDRQETGSVSSGAIGNAVTGIPLTGWTPADWGSPARLQCVMSASYISTPMASPSGVDLSGPFTNYNREVTLLSHELGHRWLTLQQANVSGNLVTIGDPSPHWLQALHQPVLVNHLLPQEASCMGGSYWQDNGNGTFTNLTQPFFQVGGYSAMDLYLMGLLPKASVPPFFLVQNPAFLTYDGNGKPVYSGSRLNITINDVTAVTGDRMPAWPATQRRFNLGLVGILPPGSPPSALLKTRLAGIRDAFTTFWGAATSHVGTMSTIVQGDYNSDGVIDAADLAAFAACRTRAGVFQSDSTCRTKADFDHDGDVDGDDFGYFQRLITGP